MCSNGWYITPVLASTKVGRRYRSTVSRGVRKILGLGEGD